MVRRGSRSSRHWEKAARGKITGGSREDDAKITQTKRKQNENKTETKQEENGNKKETETEKETEIENENEIEIEIEIEKERKDECQTVRRSVRSPGEKSAKKSDPVGNGSQANVGNAVPGVPRVTHVQTVTCGPSGTPAPTPGNRTRMPLSGTASGRPGRRHTSAKRGPRRAGDGAPYGHTGNVCKTPVRNDRNHVQNPRTK